MLDIRRILQLTTQYSCSKQNGRPAPRQPAEDASKIRRLRPTTGRGAEDAYLQLEELHAIGRHIEPVNQNCVRYPDPMIQNMHCHIRTLWDLSQEAAYQSLQQGIRYTEICCIKQVLEDTKPRWRGHIFYLRKTQPTKCHWVCLTPNLYIDDVHYMRTKDYNLARAILSCLERPEKEFGKEYSTTTTRV